MPANLVIAGRLHRRPIGKECSPATAVGLKLRIVAVFVIRTVTAFGTTAVDGSAAAGIEFVSWATGKPRRRKPERASFLLDVIPDPPIIAPGAGNVDRWFGHFGRGFQLAGVRRRGVNKSGSRGRIRRRRLQLRPSSYCQVVRHSRARGAWMNSGSDACRIDQQDACHR